LADAQRQHWAEVEALLRETPELEVKTVFELLQERHPERYADGQLRALQHVIALRKRRDELAASTYAHYCRDIERRIDRLLSGTSSIPDYERLRRHMAKHREQLLVCLYEPDVEPTNNLAERELRGAVVIRKLGGCNRSEQHAAHAVIASVAQTAHRQGSTMTNFVTRWLRPDARASAAASN
jgi:hypothetical protein